MRPATHFSPLRRDYGSISFERVAVARSLLRFDRSAEERGAGRRRAEDVDLVGMTAEFAGDVAVGVNVA